MLRVKACGDKRNLFILYEVRMRARQVTLWRSVRVGMGPGETRCRGDCWESRS